MAPCRPRCACVGTDALLLRDLEAGDREVSRESFYLRFFALIPTHPLFWQSKNTIHKLYMLSGIKQVIMAKQSRGSPMTWLNQALGRMLGAAARKDKDIVTAWREMCANIQEPPTERLTMLLEWDMSQGGINVQDVQKAKVGGEIMDAFEQANTALQIQSMAKDFSQEALKREIEHMGEIKILADEYKKQVSTSVSTSIPEELRKRLERKT